MTFGLSRPDTAEAPVDLSGMTKAELLSYADDHGVSGVSNRNTKAEITTAIEEAMA